MTKWFLRLHFTTVLSFWRSLFVLRVVGGDENLILQRFRRCDFFNFTTCFFALRVYLRWQQSLQVFHQAELGHKQRHTHLLLGFWMLGPFRRGYRFEILVKIESRSLRPAGYGYEFLTKFQKPSWNENRGHEVILEGSVEGVPFESKHLCVDEKCWKNMKEPFACAFGKKQTAHEILTRLGWTTLKDSWRFEPIEQEDRRRAKV